MLSQEETDFDDPKQHFAWALRSMPMFAGIGAVTHPAILEQWSEHLWNCGFVHRDYLQQRAAPDGSIPVEALPRQIVKFQPALRGPRNTWNNASRWVTTDTPDPEPTRLPDIRMLTLQENAAMIRQYQEAGMIPDPDKVEPEWLPAEVEE